MRLVPLLTLLLTMTLVATSLSRGAELPGCIPTPLHPSSPAPLPSSTECNRLASDMPPAPDGCPDYAPIAPPPTPIPPPCIIEARVERWNEDDVNVTEFSTYVDHPETCPEPCRRIASGARTYTKLTRIQHSAFSIPNSEWELVDADWEVSCGKDEGPLVWALLEVLNAGRWDALSIYTAPLSPKTPPSSWIGRQRLRRPRLARLGLAGCYRLRSLVIAGRGLRRLEVDSEWRGRSLRWGTRPAPHRSFASLNEGWSPTPAPSDARSGSACWLVIEGSRLRRCRLITAWPARIATPAQKARSARSSAPLIEGRSPRRPFAESAGNSRRPAYCETSHPGRIAARPLPGPLRSLVRSLC